MFTVASRFRRLKFVGSYLSTIEAVGTGSWLSVVQVLLDVSIALLVAIIEFHGGIHRGYRTISSEFFFVKRYTQSDLKGLLRIFYTWSDTQIFVQKERRTSKWGLALEFQVSGLYPLCGSVPLSGISSHLKMALSSAHRMLFRTAGELLVR